MTDDAPEPATEQRAGIGPPMAYLALAASVAAATLLVGGVLFAFASAAANTLGGSDRFRLLAQAANPFIALLSSAASALVLHLRGSGSGHEQRAPAVVLGIGGAVSLAIVLLVLNGVLTDVVGDTGGLFRWSAVANRLGALVLGAMGLWLAIAGTPPASGGRSR